MAAGERAYHPRRTPSRSGEARSDTCGHPLLNALVLDAGALVAVDRNDRDVVALLLAAREQRRTLRTSAIVVAQVWRDPSGRQARLAATLRSIEVRPVDEQLGRDAGVLLGRTGTSDAIDATVVLVADDGDEILTSDPDDITRLAAAAAKSVAVIRC